MRINNIARNTSYFTLALILQKVISFAYFTLLARNLLPEELGKYYLAISITTIFAILIDLGMTNVLVREVAKKEYPPERLLSNVLALKIPLAIIALALVVILANVMGYSEITLSLIYISSISMVLDSFTLSFYSVIRGFHNLKYESIGSVLFQVIVIVVGYAFLQQDRGLTSLMFVLAFGSIFNFLYSLGLIKFKWRLRLFAGIDKELIRSVITITIPFAVFAILQRLYMYFDTVLLSVLAGDKAVGIYQISFKIIFALQFLPLAFTASLYPAFASYWKDAQKNKNNRTGNKTKLKNKMELDPDTSLTRHSPPGRSSEALSQLSITFERSMNYLIIISLPISLGIITLADKIIAIFKEEYIDATLPLIVIMAALPFIFLNFPVGSLLNACDRQKRNTANMAIVVAVSIVLNLILIPKLSALGASITVLISNILMLFLGLYFCRSLINYRSKKILLVFAKVLFSAIIMGLVVLYLKSLLHFLLIIPMAAVLYFFLLLMFGAIKKEDIISIIDSFFKKIK